MKTKKRTRQSKECRGCGDNFITYRHYDYCANCAVNNNRYLLKSPCSDTQQKKPMNKKLTPEEKFWKEVCEKGKEIIADLLRKNLPVAIAPQDFKNDVDYRTLLLELQEAYAEQDYEDWQVKEIAEEVAIWYLRLVMKNLLSDLSNFAHYENHFFENLCEN